MIFNSPTHEMVDEWKLIWNEYKDLLHANRKSGQDLIDYLYKNYILTEIFEKNTLECVKYNVNMNETYSEKLPNGVIPVPRAFYLENKGNVITSYSIHYTKLYEFLAALKPLGIEPGKSFDKSKVAKIDGKQFRAIARITSYNVCYTKLLRK